MILDILKDQNSDIINLSHTISRDLCKLETLNPQGLGEIRSILSVLAGKFTVHICMENQNIYNRCANSKNAKLSGAARTLKVDMDNFTTQFMAYNDRWSAVSDIANDVDGFIHETAVIFEKLNFRLKKQETEIYEGLRQVGKTKKARRKCSI